MASCNLENNKFARLHKASRSLKLAGAAKPIFFPPHQKSFPGLRGFLCCHKTRRRQIVLHGKGPCQTQPPFERLFGVDFYSSQDDWYTFPLSWACFSPRQTWQWPLALQTWPETISTVDLTLSPLQGLGFALSWSLQGLRGDGHSLLCHPTACRRRKKRKKITITTKVLA